MKSMDTELYLNILILPLRNFHYFTNQEMLGFMPNVTITQGVLMTAYTIYVERNNNKPSTNIFIYLKI